MASRSRSRPSSAACCSEDDMDFVSTEEQELRVYLGKRVRDDSLADDEEELDRLEREAKRARDREADKKRTKLSDKRKNQYTQQKLDRERQVEELGKKLREGKADEFGDKIKAIQKGLDRISEATSREVGGKLSVTRSDQAVVKDVLIELYGEIMEIMMSQRELEKENASLRQELGKMEERGMERRQPREVSESEWENVERGSGRRRTYAGVVGTSESESERIKGRVVVAGKGGWKTPPPAVSFVYSIFVSTPIDF